MPHSFAVRISRFLLHAALASSFLLLSNVSFAQTVSAFPGTTVVGQQSGPIIVTVTMTALGTPSDPQAVVQGIPEEDFSIAAGGTCPLDQPVTTVGQTCTANVVFAPKYPGLRAGAVRIMGTNGKLLGSALIAGVATGSLAVLDPGRIDTVVGDTEWFYQGDGVLATSAPIHEPTAVIVDAAGNLILSDTENYRVRRVDAQSHLIETIAGIGSPGFSGDGGPATQATISTPGGLAIDGAGDIYFADSGNQIVRRIDVNGDITTVAGTPQSQGYSGDGGPATSAKLFLPEGIALDAAGNLYIADTGNAVIREVDAATGKISTVAGVPGSPGYNGEGTSTASQLNSPWTVTVGPDNSLYIADTYNNRIRRVSGGTISTIAGTGAQGFSGDDGPARSAVLNLPIGVALDPAGDLYIADSGNDRVRKVSAATGDVNAGTATIETMIGTGGEGFSGDGGPASQAKLHGPYALLFAQNGDFYFTDTINNRIRRVLATPFTLPQFPDTKVTKISSPPVIEGLDSDGNADLNLTSPTLDNAALDTTTTTCSFTTATLKGSSCNLGVEFAPATAAPSLQGSVTLNSAAPNSSAVIDIFGNALNVNPTGMSLASSANPSIIGQTVVFTATVTNYGSSPLTGPVTFMDGSSTLCSSVNLSGGIATCSASWPALGQHTIAANYAGDANNEANSASLTQTVKQAPTLVLSVSPYPHATVLGNVTLTLTASASTGTPTGNVVFYDSGSAISGNVALDGGGVATFSTTNLVPGAHHLSVQYAGDTINAPGTSNVVDEGIFQATTTTTLGTTDATPTVGDSITLTATVTSAGGRQPAGVINFTDNGSPLGSASLDGSGVATLTINSLTPGTHSIVANYGGDIDNSVSNSSPLDETVAQIATVTNLVSDANPLSAGAALHLTATVALASGATADGPLTGQVTFADGATPLGTVSLDGSGHATLAVSTLAVGGHTLVASYGGAANYATSSSAPLAQQVQKTPTTVSVTQSATTALAGILVSFTATATSSTGIPTGTATLYDGGTAIQTAPLNAQGSASFSTRTLSSASHALTVGYGGDSSYQAGTSAQWMETVNLAQPTVTLSGPANAVNVGTAVVLTGNLTSPGITPTGTLTLRDGTAVIATQAVSSAGGISFSTNSLLVGTHTLSVAYSGDSDNSSAASSGVAVTVQQVPSVTAVGSNANPGTFGQPITLTVSVVSEIPGMTGTVTFFDAGASLNTATLAANGTATLTTSGLGFGVHSITAVYQGDAQHAASTSTALDERIVEPATATLTSSLNPVVAGVDVGLTATILASGGQIPTGSVVFRDGATVLGTVMLGGNGVAVLHTTSLAVGAHVITVSYGGDSNVAAASGSLTETIQNATTQVGLTVSSNPATYGSPLTLTATVGSNGGSATGPITFVDGGTTLGSAVLSGQERASLSLSTLSPGIHTILAKYAGDGRASASDSEPVSIIVKQATSLALSSSSNPALTVSPIRLIANLADAGATTATGNVVFTEGAAQLGTAALDASGHASLTLPSLPAGTHAITASYAGDGNDFAASSPALTQTVNLRATTTTLTGSQTDPVNPQQVTLIAVVHSDGSVPPTGLVSFSSGGLVIGTAAADSTGVATLTILIESPGGSESIVASYAGDAVYAASSSTSTTVQAGPATQFTLTIDPATVNIVSKQHTIIQLSLSSIKGFSDKIQLGCLGLPFAATCTFSTPQTELSANGTTTVQLTLDTGDPLGIGAQASIRHERRDANALLCLFPAALLASLFGRRRRLTTLLVMICAIMLTFTVSGCAGLRESGTPPGAYTFKVTASGQGTGVTQSQVVTLTVTQ
ncbi:MAG TPA: Ig-like domain repeat protein [Acidobacteriaceae bacterium]|nr:Ig-like domain repeat protein [Acidobacteriaceae bacterium]